MPLAFLALMGGALSVSIDNLFLPLHLFLLSSFIISSLVDLHAKLLDLFHSKYLSPH